MHDDMHSRKNAVIPGTSGKRITDYQRVMIVGSPGAGKTTLSSTYVGPLYHTDDDLCQFDRGDRKAQERFYYRWLCRPPTSRWCLEGVAGLWGLDLWTIIEDDHPCDLVVAMFAQHRPLHAGLMRWRTEIMGKWMIVRDRLRAFDVEVIECR